MALTMTSSLVVAGKADYLTGHLGERGQSTRRRRHGNARACAEVIRSSGQWAEGRGQRAEGNEI